MKIHNLSKYVSLFNYLILIYFNIKILKLFSTATFLDKNVQISLMVAILMFIDVIILIFFDKLDEL